MVAVVADQKILVGVVYDDETELVAVVAVYLAGTGEKKNRYFYQAWYPKGYLELLALKSNRPQCMDNREKALRAWESEEKNSRRRSAFYKCHALIRAGCVIESNNDCRNCFRGNASLFPYLGNPAW